MSIRCTNCNADVHLDFGGKCPYCGRLLTERVNRKSVRYVLIGLLSLLVSGVAAYWLLNGGYVGSLWSLLHPGKVFEVSVQPPSFKVEGIGRPSLSVRQLRDLRDLFEKRRFDILTETASDIQAGFERDPSHEYQVYDFFRIFGTLLPGYEELLDAWEKHAPSHFAPHLARAQYHYARAWASRGAEFAAKTSAEQFQGMHYYFGKTAEELDRSLAINQRLLTAYIIRIGIHNAEGNSELEDTAFEEGRALFPSSFLLYHTTLWAKSPRWGGSYAEMDGIAAQALEHVETNPQLYALFGAIYADQAWSFRKEKHNDMALALYSKAITYGPHFGFLEERGRTYYFMGKYGEAIKDLGEAINLRPGVASPYTLRASIYVSMGDMSNARHDIDFVNAQFPGDPAVQESNEEIARQLLRQGHAAFKTDLAQAIAKYDMTVDLSPKCAEAFYWRGVANSKLRNNALAVADLERALNINPHDFECYRMLDQVLASEGKWGEVVDKWGQFLALEPNNAEAYFERAGANKHKGDMRSALADLDRACELGKEEACKIRKAHP